MAETFLEEQIRRIRDLTEQVSRVRPIHDAVEPPSRPSEVNGRARRDPPPRAHRETARDTARRRGR